MYNRMQLLSLSVVTICLVMLTGCDTTDTAINQTPTFLQSIPATAGDMKAPAYGRAIAETGEGGFLIAGVIKTKDRKNHIYVVRLSPQGTIRWEKTFGGEEVNDLIRTSTGDFVLAGVSSNQIYLVRFDEEGTVSWQNKYLRDSEPAYQLSDKGYSTVETMDGGFAIAGQTAIPGDIIELRTKVPSILRIDENGKKLWFEKYQNEGQEGAGLLITRRPDGGFFMAGRYASSSVFLDINGKGRLEDFSKGAEERILYHDIARLDNDEGYMITGKDTKIARGALVVSKLSTSGEQLWSKTYGGGSGEAIVKTKEGNIVIAGIKYNKEGTIRDLITLFKIDQEGNKLWEVTPKLAGNAKLYDVEQTSSGAIIATGRFKFPEWQVETYPIILRTDAMGHINNIETMLDPGQKSQKTAK